jgi:hypothetical protein
MKVIQVIAGKIASVSYAAHRPEDPQWKVVDDSFPGKVGDSIDSFGGDLTVKAGNVPLEIALKLSEKSKAEADASYKEFQSAVVSAEQAMKVAQQAIASSNKAVEAQRIAETRRDELETRYKSLAHAAQLRAADAERSLSLKIEEEGEKAAEIARKAAIERAKKDLLKAQGSGS